MNENVIVIPLPQLASTQPAQPVGPQVAQTPVCTMANSGTVKVTGTPADVDVGVDTD